MKKMFICLVVLSLLLTASVAFADNPIKLIINGAEIKTDVPPMIQNGRTLVPIRVVAEQLGFNVIYTGATKTVEIGSKQWNYKQYHDNADFVNDFETAIMCLKEVSHNIYEANIDNDQQKSGTHLIIARGWLSTATKFSNNLNKYKTEGNEQGLIKLNSVINEYLLYLDANNTGTTLAQQYPKTPNNMDFWRVVQLIGTDANVNLTKLEYDILPKLSR